MGEKMKRKEMIKDRQTYGQSDRHMQTGRTDKCGEMEQQEKAKFPKTKIRKIPVFQIRDIQRKEKERATPTKEKTESKIEDVEGDDEK
ncbi:hypothetical protein RUM43_014680 [Polyplax serrata]|uniref:Uncharacterized protein n=1 Tax=Polyplax serrata TaxID=468196 RepID=A0AAN8S6I9_POLSC